MPWYILPFFICLLILPVHFVAAAQAEKQPPVDKLTFCVEDTEFPPYNYFVRKKGIRTKTLAGYDIDLLNKVFNSTGISHEVIALPWRRCLQEVREGHIDGAMSASLNDERRRHYLPTVAYYYLTPSYYYLATDTGANSVVNSIQQLRALGNVCGIRGYNYVNFGWVETDNLIEINHLAMLPNMLKLKRCRFFLERSETLKGTLLLNRNFAMMELLSYRPVPGIKPESFHILISPLLPYADFIRSHFNRKIEVMTANGELKGLQQHHLALLKQN